MYDAETRTQRNCKNWFSKLPSRMFSVEHAQRSGGHIKIDENQIIALIDEHITDRKIEEKLNSRKHRL